MLSFDDALKFIERKANMVGNVADVLALVAAPIPLVGQTASPVLFGIGRYADYVEAGAACGRMATGEKDINDCR